MRLNFDNEDGNRVVTRQIKIRGERNVPTDGSRYSPLRREPWDLVVTRKIEIDDPQSPLPTLSQKVPPSPTPWWRNPISIVNSLISPVKH